MVFSPCSGPEFPFLGDMGIEIEIGRQRIAAGACLVLNTKTLEAGGTAECIRIEFSSANGKLLVTVFQAQGNDDRCRQFEGRHPAFHIQIDSDFR